MTDVQEIDSPTSEATATPRRRRRPRSPATAGTTTTRRRRLSGGDLIESLRESVEQLIRENRSLKRQLARATAGGSSAAPGAERTLRSIQRKVLRAVGGDGAPRRRTRAATAARSATSSRAATSTNGRRRRRATPAAEGAGE